MESQNSHARAFILREDMGLRSEKYIVQFRASHNLIDPNIFEQLLTLTESEVFSNLLIICLSANIK